MGLRPSGCGPSGLSRQALARVAESLEDEKLIIVGDFNAFQFTDGYTDVMGQLTGGVTASENLLSGDVLVDPPLVNLIDRVPAAQRYSYAFPSNRQHTAQVLDHALVNQEMLGSVVGITYARGNADARRRAEEDNPDSALFASTAVPQTGLRKGPESSGAVRLVLVESPTTARRSRPMAHHNTVLGQLLRLVSRHEFERDARRHHKGRKLRSMSRWSQFAAMAMAQLSGRCSLRDVVSNLEAQRRKLYHLGVGRVARSSLARVNEEQPHELFELQFKRLLDRCRGLAPGHGFRFKNPLVSLDATYIDLCLSLFPWAKYGKSKGAIKVHVGLDHGGNLPSFLSVTDGKGSDIDVARTLRLPVGSIVAADRLYQDFSWLRSLDEQGVFLVTRLKRGVRYAVRERRSYAPGRGVTSDQLIELTSRKGRKDCPIPLRRVGYRDAATGKHYVFLTNNFALAPRTIADIYKARWQVELFFKWIKQNLRIKSFLGTSRNAVLTQIWIAMCVHLLLAYLKFSNRLKWTLSEILRLLQLNLFERRPLNDLLQTQRDPPRPRNDQLQLALP